MKTAITGSLPIENSILNVEAIQSKASIQGTSTFSPNLASNADWFVLWRGHGKITININCPVINAGSNVMVSISEYSDTNNPAGSRFIGAAKFTVNNISPRNGGVVVNMDISWANPLNIYMSLLVS